MDGNKRWAVFVDTRFPSTLLSTQRLAVLTAPCLTASYPTIITTHATFDSPPTPPQPVFHARPGRRRSARGRGRGRQGWLDRLEKGVDMEDVVEEEVYPSVLSLFLSFYQKSRVVCFMEASFDGVESPKTGRLTPLFSLLHRLRDH